MDEIDADLGRDIFEPRGFGGRRRDLGRARTTCEDESDEENERALRGLIHDRRKIKPPPVPCSTLLRTRITKGAPQIRILDPTAGWACKHRTNQVWLPAGTLSVRQKYCRNHVHRRGLEAVYPVNGEESSGAIWPILLGV